MRHQHGFQPEPYPFVMRGPNESFEMESFEYEQQRTVDRATPKPRAALRAALQADVTSCKPGDVLDCSNILLPEAPTPEERKRITPGGALAEGASHDVTSSVTKALKALHLTHYDVNDWTISKKKHQYAIAEITEFIDRHLSRNPGVLKVTITGSASRTGTKKYNDILSCRRAKEAAKLIRLGLWGYQKKLDRVLIDESGQGFCAATCKTKNECENPDYRATLIVVHEPDKKPDPIPPEPKVGCLFQIRCCSFRAVLLEDLALDMLLDQRKIEELSKKYPLLKPLVTKAYSAVKNWLKKALKKSKLAEQLEKLIPWGKFIFVELIHVKAVFQIEDRDPHRNSSTLCYTGWGLRVKIPDVPGLDKELDKALKQVPGGEWVKKQIKDAIRKAFKVELGLEHLEGKCAPASFVPFQLSGQLQGPSNEPTCLRRGINVFEGDAEVGTDVTVTVGGPDKIGLAFANKAFASGNARLAKCGPICDRRGIMLPLGQSKGFELFLASRGELKSSSECNCVECAAATRFVRPLSAGQRRVLRHKLLPQTARWS